VAAGQKVPVAKLGARLAGGMEIKKVKIKGVESCGMICSEAELGISEDHSGIMVLDTDAPLGTPLVAALEFDDYILDFELTPNRGDSMSAIGIARDLAALAEVSLRKPTVDIRPTSGKAADYIKVTIDDPQGCPRYAARIIKFVRIAPSPWWIQRRLLTAGMRPISNIVDITNFVMLETGNPLHAFDYDRLGSKEILVRRASDGEPFATLDGREHRLNPEVLMITNGRKGVAAAGVMGGLDSEVADNTQTLLLEAAYFNPSVIRRSRKRLETVSESSSRFEKGVDPRNVPYAMDRAAYLFQEICGGEVLDGTVDCYPSPIEPVTIDFRPARCNAVLGTEIPAERMSSILVNLGFAVDGTKPMAVTVPTYRPDIAREIDLIEEISRIEGYDNIPDATENIGPLLTRRDPFDRLLDEMRQLLTGCGFDEIVGHGLENSRLAAAVHPDVGRLHIINPVSVELDIVRNSLMVTALNAIAHNVAHRNLDLRLFELGKAYFPPDDKGNWVEEDRLMLAVSGCTPAGWREEPRPLDFYDLTGACLRLADHFGWPEFAFESAEAAGFEPGRAFLLLAGGEQLGVIGQLSEKISRKFEIKQTVFLAELSLLPLIKISDSQKTFTPLPTYPSALRDLALVVDETAEVGAVVAAIRKTAGKLGESVTVFDLYTGKPIAEGKKSIGIAISFRSRESSLSSEEVDKMQEKIIAVLKSQFDAEVRDR
jgi:phenylalanyl-tRNA synthetase beta chain